MSMNFRSPSQIRDFLMKNSHNLDTPEAFIGTEPGTVGKEREPDGAYHLWLHGAGFPYTQTMGNHSVPLLYNHVNRHPKWSADRVYALSSHKEDKIFTKAGIPMFGIGSKRPMAAYDIIGYSLSFNMLYQNIIRALQMSGIPIRRRDREGMDERYPLIIAGGNVFGQPMSVAPLFDMVWVGEIEDEPASYDAQGKEIFPYNPGLDAFLDHTAQWIEDDPAAWGTRDVRAAYLLDTARKFPWIFVPKFYKHHYETIPANSRKDNILLSTGKPRGEHPSYTRHHHTDVLAEGVPAVIKKRIVHDLDQVPMLENLPISFFEAGGTGYTGEIEASRSCSAKCLFCVSTFRYGPFRVRSSDRILDGFRATAKNTGAMAVSPLTLEWGTHPAKKLITKTVLAEISDSMSIPSLRVDNIAEDAGFPQLMRMADKKSITIAVEGASQRLRTAQGKGITEEQVLQAVDNAIRAGMQRIKMYFISDLPGETEEDMLELCLMLEKIDNIRRAHDKQGVKIRISWTPLCIQGNAPLQWLPVKLDDRHLGVIFPTLRRLNIAFSLGKKANFVTRYYASLYEMGDEVAGEILLDYGERIQQHYFGALPRSGRDELTKLLKQYGRSWYDYHREKDDDEVFQWDMIDILVLKKYMRVLYENMQAHLKTMLPHVVNEWADRKAHEVRPGYLWRSDKCVDRCPACGACNREDLQKILRMRRDEKEDDKIRLTDVKIIDQRSFVGKLRVKMWIPPELRYANPSHWRMQLRRASTLANYGIAKREVRSASDHIDVRNWMAGVEFLELGVIKKPRQDELPGIVDMLNKNLVGPRILDIKPFPKELATMQEKDFNALYRIEVDAPANVLRKSLEAAKSNPEHTIRRHVDIYRFGAKADNVPWHSIVRKAWVETEGVHTFLFVVMKGDCSPYEVLTSLISGRPADAYKLPAFRIDLFIVDQDGLDDWFTPNCQSCGKQLARSIMGEAPGICLDCRERGVIENNRHPIEQLLSSVDLPDAPEISVTEAELVGLDVEDEADDDGGGDFMIDGSRRQRVDYDAAQAAAGSCEPV